MNEQTLSVIRSLLTLLGSFLIGRSILGNTLVLDSATLELIIVIAMAAFGIVMSIIDKTINEEKLQGFLRHIVLTVGGILVALGRLDPAKLELWLGVIASLVPIVYGFLSKNKTQKLATGEIALTQLKGARPQDQKA
jgi:hypothetical protein